MILQNLLVILLILILIPLSLFIYYVGQHLLEKNGDASKFRKAMFKLACAKEIFLVIFLGHILKVHHTQEILIPLNFGALFLAYTNWNALFVTLRILNKEKGV